MNSLVVSATCGVGGLFHDGTGGRSLGDLALAARGKNSGSGEGLGVSMSVL